LVRALVGAQLKVSLVPANRVRQFARAAGILAKTDCIDLLIRNHIEQSSATAGGSELSQHRQCVS